MHCRLGPRWSSTPVSISSESLNRLRFLTSEVPHLGEFYAYDFGTGNLDMLSRFFAKYPEYADRTFLSVKGGVNFEKRGPDGSWVFLPLRRWLIPLSLEQTRVLAEKRG
jgi:hypothetical protein